MRSSGRSPGRSPGQQLKSGLTALAVGIVLVAALDWAAAAATGRATILGKWNQAGRTTTITNTGDGVALDLRAKKGPALRVDSDKRVNRLNADQLDGRDGSDFRTNRNTTYHWSVSDHTGGFSQAIPSQRPGSYLISFSVQMAGAAGSVAKPNVINCRIIHSGVSGSSTFLKAVLGESQVTSVATPPALGGTSPLLLAPGDTLRLSCTMSRDGQKWSTSPHQPVMVNLLRVDGTDVNVAPLGRSAG